jgi:hypothetical protein
MVINRDLWCLFHVPGNQGSSSAKGIQDLAGRSNRLRRCLAVAWQRHHWALRPVRMFPDPRCDPSGNGLRRLKKNRRKFYRWSIIDAGHLRYRCNCDKIGLVRCQATGSGQIIDGPTSSPLLFDAIMPLAIKRLSISEFDDDQFNTAKQSFLE